MGENSGRGQEGTDDPKPEILATLVLIAVGILIGIGLVGIGLASSK